MSASYHNYQQILVLSGPSAGLKSTRARRKFTKSVDGCLHCKQRRKKCDEKKPECRNCVRRGIDCQWPDHVKEKPFADPLLHHLISIQEQDLPSHDNDAPSEESMCYDSFVNVFLPSITPAHCHPLLSPKSILLPYAVTNTTVKEIFLACGAALLAFSDDSFVPWAHSRYHSSLNMLIRDIQQSKDGCEDHLFISVQLLQTLCLRDKSLGLNATKSAAHITAAYEILKKRFYKRPTVSPLDRILTEHFVFNYSVTLMMCHHNKLSAVPSPFSFFEQFGYLLEVPLNNQSNDMWLNHPILGIGLKSHEISAKCSWMCRLKKLPLIEEDLKICKGLKKEAYDQLTLLNSIDLNYLDKGQKLTLSFSKSVLHSCTILLKRLCDHTVTIDQVQDELLLVISDMDQSTALDPDHFQSIWAMFVAGSVSVKSEHRIFISERFQRVSNVLHSSLSEKVMRYLEIVWSEEANHPVGLDFLFDTTVLDIVCS